MSTPLHHAAQKALAALEVCTGRTTGAGVMRVRAIAEVREALANVDQTNTSAGRVQKPPGNRQVMQMALDALGAMKDAMLDQGVNTDPAHPNRMALNYGVTAMRKLRAALAAPHYPLPDSLYPDSKDWLAGDYADRVEWLHTMYESERQVLEAYLAAPQGEPVAWGVDWGSRGERTCVSIVKKHADGTIEVIASEYEPERGAAPQPPVAKEPK